MLVLVFAAAHAVYYALGVRFDERPLTTFWQYLDVDLLRNDLSRSLFYLHSQPPVWNLYLGLVLKAFPAGHAVAFSLIALALGLALFLALVSLLRRLGASPLTAAAASTLFVLSPSFVLHEQMLFYASPLAMMLTLSAVLLDEFVRHGHPTAAFGFYATLLVLAGTWGLFHLIYLLVVTAGLLVLVPERRRAVAPGCDTGAVPRRVSLREEPRRLRSLRPQHLGRHEPGAHHREAPPPRRQGPPDPGSGPVAGGRRPPVRAPRRLPGRL